MAMTLPSKVARVLMRRRGGSAGTTGSSDFGATGG
jgi:hypothetical protein